jgi:small-conductance mechanosensitive channel
VKIRGEYVQAVKERFDEAGIDIPYPIRTLDGDVDIEVTGETVTEHLEAE